MKKKKVTRKRKFIVSYTVTAVVEVDAAVVTEVLTDDWQKDFYTIDSPAEVSEHLAYNVLRHGSSLSSLDGFAHLDDSQLRVSEVGWESVGAKEMTKS